jgi:DNA repair exonuclease SbcCD ATPase subunit
MRSRFWILPVLLVTFVLVACGGKSEKSKTAFNADAELAKVKAARSALADARNQLEAVHSELKALDAKGKLSAEDEAKKKQLEEEVKQAQKKVDDAFSTDQQTLAGFLNVALNEMPDASQTREGLNLYAESAIRNAKEFIANNGDYSKAIDLLKTAQGYFEAVNAPVPDALTQELNTAEEMRTLTKERFDQVRKGMTEEQVKAITGTPFYANVRENEVRGKKIVSWLFNRSDGGVAGVFFEKGRVYSSEWDVKKPQ